MTAPTHFCIACGFRHTKSFKSCRNKTTAPPPLSNIPSLFDPPPPEPEDLATIQARFEEFHRLNPWIYEAFVKLAYDYMHRGYPRVGIGHLTEILRWQRRMETYDPTSEFKISNDYRSRYARLLMSEEPSLDGFITIRSLRTE